MDIPAIIKRSARYFLPEDLEIRSWDDVRSYFEDLDKREVSNDKDLDQWLRDLSELEAVLEEEQAWRYIRMSVNTRDEEASKSFHYFVEKIEPEMAPYQNRFDKRILDMDFPIFEKDEALGLMKRRSFNHDRVFRVENIPLQASLQAKSQEFGQISSEMTVEVDGKTFTLQQAGVMLKDTDRNKREKVYRLITGRRLQDKDKLNKLFNELIDLRSRLASNAGFENYRDYKFVEMCRFDYGKEACFDFHESISKSVLPIIEEIDKRRKTDLGLDPYRPWDGQVDAEGRPGLKPFESAEELVGKTIRCFTDIDPYFGQCISTMSNMKYLDLDSREGKAPGGFNYPLYEIGVPFIYMNSAGSFRDLVTMVHEGGHAIHSFLSRSLRLTAFKELTSEVAELASMSMELISMEHWGEFFPSEEDYKRARREQLEQVIGTLPWVAQIDSFQHWIYENPGHSTEEREEKWGGLMDTFGSSLIDWSGLEEARLNLWQKQLHLYEVPFYYIEYGMAQLGAIAVWRNYKKDRKKAIAQYRQALSLGYSVSIDKIYKAAGIEFNFSRDYVEELMAFVRSELRALD